MCIRDSRQAPDQEELSDNLAEPETDGPDEEEIQYSVAQIKEATKKLPAGYRIILSLYLFEGYDMEEIASILKIQPPSVRSQYPVSYTHLDVYKRQQLNITTTSTNRLKSCRCQMIRLAF